MSVICRLPSGGTSSFSDSNLNVFTQLEEPETKDGIWIKTDKKYKQVVTANKLFEDNGTFEQLSDLPFSANTAAMTGVYYKGKIYLFNLYSFGTSEKFIYTYSIEDNAWTKISDASQVPSYYCTECKAFVAKGKIYLLMTYNASLSSYGLYIRTYDGETWTTITSQQVRAYPGIYYNDCMYFLPRSYDNSSSSQNLKVYDDKNNVFSLLGLPFYALYDVYDYTIRYKDQIVDVVGGYTNIITNGCRYSIKNNTDAPTFCNDGKYYFIRSSYENVNNRYVGFDTVYKVEIEEKNGKTIGFTKTAIQKVSEAYSNITRLHASSSVVVNACDGFYVIGGMNGYMDGSTSTTNYNASKKFYSYIHSSQIEQEPNSIIVVKDEGTNTDVYSTNVFKLSKNGASLPIGFNNIVVTDENGKIQFDAPIYYGDGTAWHSLNGITE